MVSLEWIVFEDGWRMRVICTNGVPELLPTMFLKNKAHSGTSVGTANTYANHLLPFFKWLDFHKIKLKKLIMADLAEFSTDLDNTSLDYLFIKETVVSGYRLQVLSCVVRFIEWCLRYKPDQPVFHEEGTVEKHYGLLAGIDTGNARKRIETLRKKQKELLVEHLTQTELDEVRRWVSKRWRDKPEMLARNKAIIEFLYESAVRRGELLSVHVQDIDWDKGFVKIPYLEEEYEKGRKKGRQEVSQKTGERIVIIGHGALQLMRQYYTMYRPKEAIKLGHGRFFCLHQTQFRGQPLTGEGLDYIFDVANLPVEEGGCKIDTHLHAHIFRHTWATLMTEDNMDQAIVQAQLGHKNPASTKIYSKVSPELRRKQLDDHRKLHPERYV